MSAFRRFFEDDGRVVVGEEIGLQEDGPSWQPVLNNESIYPITTPDTFLVQTERQYAYAVLAGETTRWGGKEAWKWNMHYVETRVEEVNGRPTIVGGMGSRFGIGYSRRKR